MKKVIQAIILATWIGIWWCSTESIEKKEPIISETSKKCDTILFWLWEHCVTKGEVKSISLSWNSNYSIAKKSWDQSDTWFLKSSDIKQNTNVLRITNISQYQFIIDFNSIRKTITGQDSFFQKNSSSLIKPTLHNIAEPLKIKY